MTPENPTAPPLHPRRAPLVCFVVLAYALSWAWWLPLAVRHDVVGPGQGWPSHLPGLLGPALAAIVTTALYDGRAGLRALWTRAVRVRAPWTSYAMVLATAALLLATCVEDRPLSAASLLRYSGAPELAAATVPYVLLLNGFGEELGWRGFLGERLLPRHGLARSALWIAPVWAAWHLPLFWVVASFRDLGPGGVIGWTLGLGCGSVFLLWLYDRSRRAVPIVAAWHTAFNFATATEAAQGAPAAIASTVVMLVALGLLVRPRAWRPSEQALSSNERTD